MPSITSSQIPSATTLAMTSPQPLHASLSPDRSAGTGSGTAPSHSGESPAISMTTLPSPTSPIHLTHHQQQFQHQQHHGGGSSNSSSSGYYHHQQRPLSYAAPTDSWDHPFFRPAVLHIDRPPRAHLNAHPQSPTSPTLPTSAPLDQPHPPTRPTVRIDQYTLGRTLGQGSMGKVKLATDPDGTRYAIKIIPRSGHLTNEDDAAAETRVVREASVLFLLNHPNIVKLVDALVTPQHFYLVMEYVDGPQLLDHVVARGRLSEEEARRVAVGLISAMAYCHHHHIVHRDLKIENILLTKSNQIKLLDFGLANFYDPHAHLHTFCGSLYFASPELISAQPYTGPEVDAWSLGVVLYVLVTARVPFDAPTLPELHAKIKRGNPQFPPHCSPQLVDLLRALLTVDPRARATVDQAAAHAWLCGATPVPVAHLVPGDRDARAAALVRHFGPHRSASPPPASDTDLGPLHEDATILLAQLTHLPVRDLQRGIGTRDHHLHLLHVLTYEWLGRAYASAAAKGEFLGGSQASLQAQAGGMGKRTSVALAHASAVAGRRASYFGAPPHVHAHGSLARRPAGAGGAHLSAVDEAIVVSQAGSLQSRRASGSVLSSGAGTSVSGGGHGTWVVTDAVLAGVQEQGSSPDTTTVMSSTGAGAAATAADADACPPSTPQQLPASPRSAHVHMSSAHTRRHQAGAQGMPTELPPATVQPGARYSPPTGDVRGPSAGGAGAAALLAPGVHRTTSTGSADAYHHHHHQPRPRTISGPTAGTGAGPIVFTAPPPPPVPQAMPAAAPASRVLEQGRQRVVSNETNASRSSLSQSQTDPAGSRGAFKIEIQPLPANTAAAVQMEAAAAAARPAPATVRPRVATAPAGKPGLASPSRGNAVAQRAVGVGVGVGGGASAMRHGSAPDALVLESPADSHASLTAASPSASASASAAASPVRVVGRKPSMQSLFAGSHVISLPNGYAQPRALGGLNLVDPVARIAQLARGMHLEVSEVDSKQCLVTHRPSVSVENRIMVAQVKLTRQGFGLLRPCLAFRQKSGDADAFRMVVQGLQREWGRVVVSASGGDQDGQSLEDGGGEEEGQLLSAGGGGAAVVAAA